MTSKKPTNPKGDGQNDVNDLIGSPLGDSQSQVSDEKLQVIAAQYEGDEKLYELVYPLRLSAGKKVVLSKEEAKKLEAFVKEVV